MAPEPITIVGAGLGGSLLAVALARLGREVTVYERRPDPRKGAAGGGRSINLALSARGLHALKEAGLQDAVLKIALPMEGRLIHSREGRLAFQRYGRFAHECNYSVSRAELNRRLIEAAAAEPRVRLHFDHRCRAFDVETRALEFETPDGRRTVPAPHVIGADGAYSAVRQSLQRRDRFDFSQDYLDWGYKELTIPPARDGGFALSPTALHIWPRHEFMLIALPNLDRSFTATLFLPHDGPSGFSRLADPGAVRSFFEAHFPDALPHMPQLAEEFASNPSSSLVAIRCFPWHIEDRVALLGDACHAVVPFYGQGMNASFEDCSVLTHAIAEASTLAGAFERYEAARKSNTDALAELSNRNFVEMRSKVASKAFLLRQGAEKVLARLFPDRFIPLYNMVTHTLMPYADAVAKARRQDRWLNAVGGAAALAAVAALAWALARMGL